MTTLTPRQLEILRMHAEGLTSRDIRKKLFIAENTTKTHNAAIRKKLGAHTMAQAVANAYEQGILSVDAAIAERDSEVAMLRRELEAVRALFDVMARREIDLRKQLAAASTLLRGMARRSVENRQKWHERAERVRQVLRESALNALSYEASHDGTADQADSFVDTREAS